MDNKLMSNAIEMIVQLARENERLKIETERLRAALELANAERGQEMIRPISAEEQAKLFESVSARKSKPIKNPAELHK